MSRFAASESRFHAALALSGLGVGFYVASALVKPPGVDLSRHVALFLVSFAFYLAAVLLLLARGRTDTGAGGRWVLFAALVWAVILRVTLLATTPSLSDDIFRYVWDGRVAAVGIDPYRYAPSAPELAALRDSVWNGVNAKSMPSPYPPLAEGLFALVYRVAPDSLTAMQAAAVLFDLGVAVVLLLMLRRLGMDGYRVLIYAWNPLVLVQFAHSGHFDAAMLLPLLGAIFAVGLGRRAASGVLLGVSMLVKLVPAIVGPLFLPAWGALGVVAAAATVGLGALPILGTPALAGVLTEASDARFNDSAGYLLTLLFAPLAYNPDALARTVAAVVVLVASLATAAAVWRRGAAWDDLLRGAYRMIGLFLLLNAVVEPWYLTWIVPFLCFVLPDLSPQPPAVAHHSSLITHHSSLTRHSSLAHHSSLITHHSSLLAPSWGWLLLSGLVVLTDLTYIPGIGTGVWLWVRLAEYVPLYLLLALWAWRRRARLLPPRPRTSLA